MLLHERPDIHQRRWFLLGVLCLSLVMVVMAVSGLNVALPSMQGALDADATDLQWIVDSYAIVFAGLLLTAGAIGDRFGRKGALLGGLTVFALGSLLGAFADSASAVIVSRSISGIGAAFVMPSTLSLLTSVFPRRSAARRSRSGPGSPAPAVPSARSWSASCSPAGGSSRRSGGARRSSSTSWCRRW